MGSSQTDELKKQLEPRQRKETQELIKKWEKDIGNIETMMQGQKMRQAYTV